MSASAGYVARLVAVIGYIALMIVALGYLVGIAAQKGWLVVGAVPLTVLPILGLHFLKPNERLAGWSALTVWLASTYSMGAVTGGEHQEVMVFGAMTAVAVAGYYRSPWLLVAAWLFHVAWDFAPRELPELLLDLPVACILFDGVVAAYLAWMTATGRLCSPNWRDAS